MLATTVNPLLRVLGPAVAEPYRVCNPIVSAVNVPVPQSPPKETPTNPSTLSRPDHPVSRRVPTSSAVHGHSEPQVLEYARKMLGQPPSKVPRWLAKVWGSTFCGRGLLPSSASYASGANS